MNLTTHLHMMQGPEYMDFYTVLPLMVFLHDVTKRQQKLLCYSFLIINVSRLYYIKVLLI
jgi:hypothetical protein